MNLGSGFLRVILLRDLFMKENIDEIVWKMDNDLVYKCQLMGKNFLDAKIFHVSFASNCVMICFLLYVKIFHET